jgi:peptidoglycan/xylan/chitin deacetylase (PgdA/CDA1 family)
VPHVAIEDARNVCLLFHDVYVTDPRESGFGSPAADRYKLSVTQFDRELAALVRVSRPALPFALTFDDGGISFYTVIADRLEALGWRAHCFVVTDMIGQPGFLTRAQIQELDRRGHRFGSHSASHPARMSAWGEDDLVDEWARSRAVLQDIIGGPVVTASVPGGFFSRRVARAAAIAGVQTLMTSEPVTRPHYVAYCRVLGRFALRHYNRPEFAARLVDGAPWARWAAWADWNAKALIKPILGNAYTRIADRLMAQKAATPSAITTQEKRL